MRGFDDGKRGAGPQPIRWEVGGQNTRQRPDPTVEDWRDVQYSPHPREPRFSAFSVGFAAIAEVGLEPTPPCGKRILNPPRLPFRHSAVVFTKYQESKLFRTPSCEPEARLPAPSGELLPRCYHRRIRYHDSRPTASTRSGS